MQLYSSISQRLMQPFDNMTLSKYWGEIMYFKRIEDLRIDHDKTQQDVADYLGCQREVYRRYEKGTRMIPVDYLIKLSKYYSVSIDYMLGLSNKKNK